MARPDDPSTSATSATSGPAAVAPGAAAAPTPAAAPHAAPAAAHDDSLADTIAPTAGPPTQPGSPPATGSRPPGSASDDLWSGDTIDAASHAARRAPTAGPELPVVDADRYTAEREVARGGMGRIIAARDHRLARPVAIKELLGKGGDAPARFRREALITARLQHPAIVPVYEAGRWPSGEPFYAMKLVAGRALDKVIEQKRTLEERLALLPAIIAATEAIAYAHSQRVIHRDLKPSNVLVGDFGETVVIDWGLAKDLDADDASQPPPAASAAPRAPLADQPTRPEPVAAAARDERDRAAAAPSAPPGVPFDLGATHPAALAPDAPAAPAADSAGLTLAGAVMGTPAYMPPEQARGEAVDERADVFALGAMLYHLLAGAPPYQARTAAEVVEAAMKGAVVPLRQRAPRAAPDLVAIVARAMAREPADRYPSARELADELRRFQTGQLVGAHRYTARQRLVRFVRKHRGVVAISAVSLTLFALLGTLAIRRIIIERDAQMAARELAETRRAAAEKLVDFVVRDLRARLDPIGRTDLLGGIGAGALAYYDALGGLVLGPDDRDRRAAALDIVGAAAQASGDLDAALSAWRREEAELDALVAAAPDDPATRGRRRRAADAALAQGGVHQARGATDDAIAAFTAGIGVYEQLLHETPDDDDLWLGAAAAHDRLGDLHRPRGHVDLALAQYQAALEQRERVAARHATDRAVLDAVAHSHHELATAYIGSGATQDALRELDTAIGILGKLVAAEPENVKFLADLSHAQAELGAFQRQIGELDQAIATYHQLIPVVEGLVRRDPLNATWQRDRGNDLSDLGFALLDQGDAAGARDDFTAAIANHEALLAKEPDDTRWLVDLSRTYGRRGDARLSLGDTAGAIEDYQQAKAQRDALLARDPHNPVWRRTAAWGYHKLATGLAARGGKGDLDAAIALHRQALALRVALAKETAHQAAIADELAQSQVILGGLLVRRGDVDEGLALLDAGIAGAQAIVDGDPLDAAWKVTLVRGLAARGDAYRGRGDHVRAIADLERAVAAAGAATAKAPDNSEWQTQLAMAHWGLARCLAAGGGDPRRVAREAGVARELVLRLDQAGRLRAEYKAFDAEVRAGL